MRGFAVDRARVRDAQDPALLIAAGIALSIGPSVPALAADPVTLTYYIDDNPTNVATADGLKKAFEAENPATFAGMYQCWVWKPA